MSESQSFQQFVGSLQMAEELLRIEKDLYPNPLRQGAQKAIQGLRGGAVVLTVAAFENFLRTAFEEYLSLLSKNSHLGSNIAFEKLPEKMRVSCVYFTLEQAMKGPPFQEAPPKVQRLTDIHKACRMLISEILDPRVFSNTGSNPNSKTVTLMFSNLGIQKVFDLIKIRFEQQWNKPIADGSIADTLDEIVRRRHVVAHTADALNITRAELKESIRFLKIVAKLLDAELKKCVDDILV
jgi:hypothetical protein